ncbi:MAG: HNH endonuclease [Tannerellaceae bacterium]|jgi:hypothetical protein|nr:HNH endonuclease [Tannerellaceae bacterium]
MVYLEKSQPAPSSLNEEKQKVNGNYKTPEVLDRLKHDFKNKCYLCEQKEPTAIQVEHFRPHKGDKDLEFDWDNLFLSCAHCNNTKLAKEGLLNCTDKTQDVENRLKYIFNPFPFEKVRIEALDDSQETRNTKDLLMDIYNGTTHLKQIESSNLRNSLLNEIMDFQRLLCDYFKDTHSEESKQYLLMKIRGHLSRASGFATFKRWIIKDNPPLRAAFEGYFD